MVALSITAAEVQGNTSASHVHGIAAETITPAQPCRVKSDGTIGLTDCDSATENSCDGVSVHGSLAGQFVTIQKGGDLTVGATAAPAVGITYYAGPTAGTIVPEADVASGDDVIEIGTGKSTGVIALSIRNKGITKA